MTRAAVFLIAAVFFCVPAHAGERAEAKDMDGDGKIDVTDFYDGPYRMRSELDTDKDGKVDLWAWYVAGSIAVRTHEDTNKDGRPDKFYTKLNGKEIMLREFDRNGDGKVDERAKVRWDVNKTIATGGGSNGLQRISNPGYVTLWKEKDVDFDGVIDHYTERGNRNASKKKVGTKIDTQPAQTSPAEEELKKPKEPSREKGESAMERLVRQQNEKYNYSK